MKKDQVWQSLIHKEMDDPTIPAYTEVPDVPALRLTWLQTGLQHVHGMEQAVSAALVQLGLDLHDRIDPNPVHSSLLGLRKLQVDILAGDYYSSRFYRLLARVGEVKMIERLCVGIMAVNQTKIELYEQLRSGQRIEWTHYVTQQIRFRNALYEPFVQYVPDPFQDTWRIGNTWISTLEWLLDEWRAIEQGSNWINQWASVEGWPTDFRLEHQLAQQTQAFISEGSDSSAHPQLLELRNRMGEQIAFIHNHMNRYADAGR